MTMFRPQWQDAQSVRIRDDLDLVPLPTPITSIQQQSPLSGSTFKHLPALKANTPPH
jgi:hypothetical protein